MLKEKSEFLAQFFPTYLFLPHNAFLVRFTVTGSDKSHEAIQNRPDKGNRLLMLLKSNFYTVVQYNLKNPSDKLQAYGDRDQFPLNIYK